MLSLPGGFFFFAHINDLFHKAFHQPLSLELPRDCSSISTRVMDAADLPPPNESAFISPGRARCAPRVSLCDLCANLIFFSLFGIEKGGT